MSKVGVLGTASNTAVGSYTVYTVPSNRGVRAKVMLYGQAHASGTVFTLTVNGIPVLTKSAPGSEYFYSSQDQQYADAAAAPNGEATAASVAPGPQTYYLAAGDTVSYTIGTNAAQTCQVDVVGVEVEVS
jgi:hypothetical protein